MQTVTNHNIDLAHATRLNGSQRVELLQRADEFLGDIKRDFSERYLHLDVAELPAKHGRRQQYELKALLVTNRGRYYSDAEGFGIEQAAKNAFGALEEQISSRLGRLEETPGLA